MRLIALIAALSLAAGLREGAAMSLPTVAPAPSLPAVELLCRPEARALVGYTRRIMPLPGPDRGKVALFSYSGVGAANWLFIVDTRDLSVERYAMPGGEIGSHSSALAADGAIYTMPHNGRAWRFGLATRAFTELGRPLPVGEYAWEAIGHSNGCIYFGTWPSAIFGEYNPATGKFWLQKQVAPDTKYVTGLRELPDGRVRFLAWGPGQHLTTFDPKSRTLAPYEEPPAPAGPPPKGLPVPPGDERAAQGYRAPDGRGFLIGSPSSRLYQVLPGGKLKLVSDKLPPGEVWMPVPVDDAWCMVSMLGVFFRFDPADGSVLVRQLPNQSAYANPIMFLAAAGGRAIGAHYSQMNLFTVEPDTGKWQESGLMISRVTGEPMCGVAVGKRLYLGIYIQALLSVYDPARPFEWDRNPREIARTGHEQMRPMAMATDGRRVFTVSHAEYSKLPGALSVLDTQTERLEVFTDVVPGQNLETVAWDATSGLVVGGSYRYGDCLSHPPLHDSAVLFAWDPKTKKTVRTAAPWPGADSVRVLAVTLEGLGIATRDGSEVLLFDPATLKELARGPFPLGFLAALHRGEDGALFGLAGGKLFRWDTARNIITPLADAPGCQFVCQPRPGVYLLADRSTIYRFRAVP